jgi:hypothetical protein
MGDSGISVYLSVLALVVIVGAFAAFLIALRARSRGVRVAVGVILLAVAVLNSILSLLATLVVGALGVAVLVLAFKKPLNASSRSNAQTEPKDEFHTPEDGKIT